MSLDAAFTAFAQASWPRLVRAAVLLGSSPSTAEDVVQTSLVACYRRWQRVGVMADSPEAYCYRVLANNLTRRPREWPEIAHDVVPDEPAHVPIELVENSSLRASLLRLPYDQRAVLVCTFYLDMSEADAAQALGVPAGTVKSRKARALAALSRDPDLAADHPGVRDARAV